MRSQRPRTTSLTHDTTRLSAYTSSLEANEKLCQVCVSRVYMGRSITTRSKVVIHLHHFCFLVITYLSRYISWPTVEQLHTSNLGFQRAGFVQSVPLMVATFPYSNQISTIPQPIITENSSILWFLLGTQTVIAGSVMSGWVTLAADIISISSP